MYTFPLKSALMVISFPGRPSYF